MALAFVPLYIKYLGIESYGLIGIFALLQTWLSLLDIGMKPALGREMARFTGGAHTAQSIRNLLRSIEIIGIFLAGAVGLGIWAGSGWLATHWVTAKHLPTPVVAHAFAIMGLVSALRFLEDIYVSSIVGLQRQVLQNTIATVFAVVRGLGAVAVLIWVSPSIDAFFLWQGLISLLSVSTFAVVVRRILPSAPSPARFSLDALVGIRRFAAGMLASTLLSLMLTQVDKLLLSRLLTLEAFGYYALAGVVANGLYTLAAPVTGAYYPRFTQLIASGNEQALRLAYHQGSQMVTVLTGSAAVLLMAFSERVLRLWTGNAMISQRVAPLVVVLSLGTLLNALMVIPYQMQVAYGWTALAIRVNIVAVALLVPAILWAVPSYGAIGAARIWVILNTGYLVFDIPLMHRRLLRAEKWHWYAQDVAAPIAAASVAVLLCRWLMPRDLGKLGELSVLVISSICVLAAAILAAPRVRDQLARYLPARIRSMDVRAA
jgi:O-antigen/teichoic acid export membrane protein